MGSGRDGGREKEKTGGWEEAVGTHNDRVLEMMEGRQQQVLGALNATTTDMLAHNDLVLEMMVGRHQQVLGALNATTTDMLARIEGLREEMREELTKAVQDVHIPASQSTQQPAEDKTAAVPCLEYTSKQQHCRPADAETGRRNVLVAAHQQSLYGTVGSLEVVSGGNYSSNLQCSWELNFPQESLVNLSWDYIDTEASNICHYDWVQVEDLTRDSQLVYGLHRDPCQQPKTSVTISMMGGVSMGGGYSDYLPLPLGQAYSLTL
ncbi:hypothetical protein GWK47_037343 [Chionoecetes opilio]|uniref:CUB domain-containing protein n=1 Tax=Chionoecetes opilio TaxID=41210 RepID=A0A8J4YSM4_CHIOP|nr:hypothetical protein GWK47_037343 [Chionoecetes opilio]